MSINTGAVYVVVQDMASGFTKFYVHGVYADEKTAHIAAWRPEGSLTVLRYWLNSKPSPEGEVVERD